MTSLTTVPVFSAECAQRPERATQYNAQLFSFGIILFAAMVLALVGAFTSTPLTVIAGGMLTAITSIAFAFQAIIRSGDCN